MYIIVVIYAEKRAKNEVFDHSQVDWSDQFDINIHGKFSDISSCDDDGVCQSTSLVPVTWNHN